MRLERATPLSPRSGSCCLDTRRNRHAISLLRLSSTELYLLIFLKTLLYGRQHGSTASCVIKLVARDVLNASRMGDWLANPASLLA